MGYTTDFSGAFKISPALTAEQVAELNAFGKERHDRPGFPGIWCDWEAPDEHSLAWNQSEKFYNYVEWLDYLIKTYFRPWGRQLDGEVQWQGEEVGDVGKIRVVANKVTVLKAKFVEWEEAD